MSSGNPEHYRELFHQISKDNEQAFAQFFHIFTPKLLPFVNKLTRNEHIAKELVQETFLQLWVNRSKLSEVENPSAWIYRIASNISVNWLKTQSNRQRLQKNIVVVESENPVPDYIDSRELDLVIQKAVNLLPEKRQEVYRLSREQGLTHQQIADKLNLSVNTVRAQIGNSLKFIQEFINKETGLSIITIMILLGLK